MKVVIKTSEVLDIMNPPRANKIYSATEDQFLLYNEGRPIKWLAKELGRTSKAISWRLSVLRKKQQQKMREAVNRLPKYGS